MNNSNVIMEYSGRQITVEDIEMICWIRKRYPRLSRLEFTATVCELIGWVTDAGNPKSSQCGELLPMLEEQGLVELPPLKEKMSQAQKGKKHKKKIVEVNGEEIEGSLKEFEPITLRIAQTSEERIRWRSYVEKYHRLGDRKVFGAQLQYYITSGEKELGCLQFSAASWALEAREKWIGWSLEDRKKRLNLIVNISRSLIFPWVRIKNLVSKSMSVAVKTVPKDWLRTFCYAPVLMETFVDLNYYTGISLKASNWICLGETKGRGRNDRKHEKALSRKAIYMYPLQKDFRAYLKGEKQYKVVAPE